MPRPRIELRRSIATSHTAVAIFDTLCNLPVAPTWLPNCTALELLDDGRLAAGSRLRYSFREFQYASSLACSVTAFTPGQRITIGFSDANVEASFDFVIDDQGGATTIHHHVELLPKSWKVRLLVGAIRRGLPGRMDAALRGLERATLTHV